MEEPVETPLESPVKASIRAPIEALAEAGVIKFTFGLTHNRRPSMPAAAAVSGKDGVNTAAGVEAVVPTRRRCRRSALSLNACRCNIDIKPTAGCDNSSSSKPSTLWRVRRQADPALDETGQARPGQAEPGRTGPGLGRGEPRGAGGAVSHRR